MIAVFAVTLHSHSRPKKRPQSQAEGTYDRGQQGG